MLFYIILHRKVYKHGEDRSYMLTTKILKKLQELELDDLEEELKEINEGPAVAS